MCISHIHVIIAHYRSSTRKFLLLVQEMEIDSSKRKFEGMRGSESPAGHRTQRNITEAKNRHKNLLRENKGEDAKEERRHEAFHSRGGA